jgi:hypothetical protein
VRLGALAAIGCTLALVIAGCGGSSSTPTSSLQGPGADPAAVLPAGTLAYAQVVVRPTGSLAAAIDAASQRFLGIANPGAKLDALIDKSLPAGESYETTFRPWLGARVGMALLSGPVSSPSYAAVFDQTNTANATAFINSKAALSNSGGGPVDKSTTGSYRGVSYVDDLTSHVLFGVVGKFVVVGTAKAFDAIVDVSKGAPSLADSSDYKNSLSGVLPGADLTAYVPLVKLVDALVPASDASNPEYSAVLSLLRNKYASSILVASATVNGTSATLDIGITNPPASTGPTETNPIASLPAGSWLALGSSADLGPSLAKGINSLGELSSLTGSSTTTNFSQDLSQLNQVTGINIQRIVGSLTTIGLFAKGANLATLEAGLVFGVKSASTASTDVTQLHTLLSLVGMSDHSFTVSNVTGAGISSGFAVTPSGSQITIDVAASGARIVFAYGKASLTDAIASGNRLGASAGYGTATSLLGSSVQPDIIVQLPQLVTFLRSFGLANTPEGAKVLAYMTRLGTLVIGSGTSSGIDHVRIVLGA